MNKQAVGRDRSREDEALQCIRLGRILVAIDGSPCSNNLIHYAIALGTSDHLAVRLVRVLEPHPSHAGMAPIDPVEWEFERMAARRHLEGLVQGLASDQVDLDCHVAEGHPPVPILAMAEQEGFDLILLGSHGKGEAHHWPLGSTALKLVSAATVSVMVVPCSRTAGSSPALQRLLVPLDGSKRTECVLPIVARLARQHHAEVLLAHVVVCPVVSFPSSQAADLEDLAARLAVRSGDAARRYVDGVATQLSAQGIRVRSLVVQRPQCAPALRTMAAEQGADLMVVCAHGATGSGQHTHGNVARELLVDPIVPTLVIQDMHEAVRGDLHAHHSPRSETLTEPAVLPERSGVSAQG